MIVKVYFDGGARPNPGRAVAAAIIADLDNETIDHVAEIVGERESNNVAEYTGLLLGLRKAQALGATDVRVFGDSRLVIESVWGTWTHDEKFEQLHREVRALIGGFARCTGEHIPREENAAADRLCGEMLKGTYRPFGDQSTSDVSTTLSYVLTVQVPKARAANAAATRKIRLDIEAAIAQAVPVSVVTITKL